MDICTVLSPLTKVQSPLMKTALKVIQNMAPDALKPCPYSGRIRLLNMGLDMKVLGWMPRGIYKSTFRTFTEDDKNLMRLGLIIQVDK